MHASSHGHQIQVALQSITLHWELVKLGWSDPISRLFENQFWSPFDKDFRDIIREIETLERVLANARRRVH